MWSFKKKTLAEKVQIVKDYVRKKQYTHRSANTVYVAIALDEFGWEDVAELFLKELIVEELYKRT